VIAWAVDVTVPVALIMVPVALIMVCIPVKVTLNVGLGVLLTDSRDATADDVLAPSESDADELLFGELEDVPVCVLVGFSLDVGLG
jgi:hypothetical protein